MPGFCNRSFPKSKTLMNSMQNKSNYTGPHALIPGCPFIRSWGGTPGKWIIYQEKNWLSDIFRIFVNFIEDLSSSGPFRFSPSVQQNLPFSLKSAMWPCLKQLSSGTHSTRSHCMNSCHSWPLKTWIWCQHCLFHFKSEWSNQSV